MTPAQRRLTIAAVLLSGALGTLFLVWFAYAVHPALGATVAAASAAWYSARRADFAEAAAAWGGSPVLAAVEAAVEVEQPVLA